MSDQMAEAIQRQMAHAQRSAWIDRRGWTDQQWIDDARSQLGDLDGSILDLVNGHVLALLRRLDELQGQCSPLNHGGEPCEVGPRLRVFVAKHPCDDLPFIEHIEPDPRSEEWRRFVGPEGEDYTGWYSLAPQIAPTDHVAEL